VLAHLPEILRDEGAAQLRLVGGQQARRRRQIGVLQHRQEDEMGRAHRPNRAEQGLGVHLAERGEDHHQGAVAQAAAQLGG
jgi:hypothetical protein